MKVLVTKEYLTNIANSIRNKKKNETKYKPEDMSAAIDTISTLYSPKFISFREYKGYELDYELQNLDTSNITTMETMFYYCNNLVSLNLNNFITNNVTSMRYMFYSCSGLTNLNLSSFNTNNVTDMSYMFASCNRLTRLDLRNFNFNNVIGHTGMFNTVPNDCLIIVADNIAKRWITTRFNNLSKVKTISEIEE